MTVVVGLANGALKLISLETRKILSRCEPITKIPSTVTFVEFDPSVSHSIRYTQGHVVMALSHSPVLYKICIDPFTLERIQLPSKHPIVMMKLGKSQNPLMKSSKVSIKYSSIDQRPIYVLQGDGILTKIVNNIIVSSKKLKKFDLQTDELQEPPLIFEQNDDDNESDESEQNENNDENENNSSSEQKDNDESDDDIDENDKNQFDDSNENDSDSKEEELEEFNDEINAQMNEEVEKELDDDDLKELEEELAGIKAELHDIKLAQPKKKKYVTPTEIKGLYGVYDIGENYVIASNKNALPIRKYTFDSVMNISPPCDFKHISICVIDDEIFLGCSNGMVQRYSFESRKRKVLSSFKRVYNENDLAHPSARIDKREEVHPMVTSEVSEFPIISICEIPESDLVGMGTSSGRVYLFDKKLNKVLYCLGGPQGSVRLGCYQNIMCGISLDRWMYMWDPIRRLPLAKIYLHSLPSALCFSQ